MHMAHLSQGVVDMLGSVCDLGLAPCLCMFKVNHFQGRSSVMSVSYCFVAVEFLRTDISLSTSDLSRTVRCQGSCDVLCWPKEKGRHVMRVKTQSMEQRLYESRDRLSEEVQMTEGETHGDDSEKKSLNPVYFDSWLSAMHLSVHVGAVGP